MDTNKKALELAVLPRANSQKASYFLNTIVLPYVEIVKGLMK